VSAAEIDEYLDHLEEPKRSTLSRLRRDILAVLPDAEQCISYGVPGSRLPARRRRVRRLQGPPDLLPHSGSVFPELANEVAGYEKSTGLCASPWICHCPSSWSKG
jgi:hypothetical protein